uniref:Syntrophin, gamma 2 n=1 Tax=Mus musculus TaxID=10090 RepID=D6RE37_MOUSE
MSAEGSQSLAAPRGRPSHLLVPARTKTALALLYDEGLENAYDVRLKLTKEVLTIQKQDVVCIGGAPPGANTTCGWPGPKYQGRSRAWGPRRHI